MTDNLAEQVLKLDDNMKSVLDDVFQKRLHVFLHGSGGTGKSYLATIIKKLAEKRGISVALTSTTGVSAINIEGVTIHSWSGIGYGRGNPREIVRKMGASFKSAIITRLRENPIIVIDEVSMLHGELLDKIDWMFRLLLHQCKRPFGGKQMIFSGDVLQLPPVEKGKSGDEPVDYFFKSNVWKQLTPKMRFVDLTYPYRYDDKDWYRMLMRVRYAIPNDDDHKILESRLKSEEEIAAENKLVAPPRLYSLRRQVDAYNKREMQKLETKAKMFLHRDIILKSKPKDVSIMRYYNPSNTLLNRYQLDKHVTPKMFEIITSRLDTLIERHKIFKVGANVMLTMNMMDDKLANGSQGVIREMGDTYIGVEFRSQPGRTMKIHYAPHYILVGKTFYIRFQIPMILSWSCTIHKIQGASLDTAVLDLGKTVFAPSQAYVALGRVKSLKGVYLTNYVSTCIKSNPEALDYATEIIKLAQRELP